MRTDPRPGRQLFLERQRARVSEWYGSQSQEVVYTYRNVVARGKSEEGDGHEDRAGLGGASETR